MNRFVNLIRPGCRPSNYVLWMCLVVYVFSAKGYLQLSDTDFSVQTAQAILTRGQLNIPYVFLSTLKAPSGKSYSKYGIGLPIYYLPFVAAGDGLALLSGRPASRTTGFLLSFANIPFAMLTLILFSKLLRLFEVSEAYSSLCLAGLGLGTLVWQYAGLDSGEEMQMALLMLAVYAVIRWTPRAVLIGGMGFGWLFLAKQLYVLFFPVFAMYLLTRRGEMRQRVQRAMLFTIPLVFAGAFDLWLNYIRFRNPMESGYGLEATLFFPQQLWRTVPLLLGSFDKGLFIYCPVLVLALFGWRSFAGAYREEADLCSVLIIENLLLAGAWYSWEGGWSPGPRLLVPFIPLWFLPIAFLPGWWRSAMGRRFIAFVVLISAVSQIAGILVKDQEIHQIKDNVLTLREGRYAPSDYVMSWILLQHKLAGQKEIYRTSDFGVPDNPENGLHMRLLDLSSYRSFAGMNVWTEQLARWSGKPVLHWLPIFGLFLIGWLALDLQKALKAATRKHSTQTPAQGKGVATL
ncbi:MAG TPA: hypothetical protein VGR47_12520 [Terracidiphilus sp.]|nr:hypothetical protein [Terracidiphilus sp.]